jgi:excisionase family DNA binding protein
LGFEDLQLLTAADVARLLHLHEQTVKVLARRGEIQSIKLGYRSLRFTPDQVRAYLEAHAVVG